MGITSKTQIILSKKFKTNIKKQNKNYLYKIKLIDKTQINIILLKNKQNMGFTSILAKL